MNLARALATSLSCALAPGAGLPAIGAPLPVSLGIEGMQALATRAEVGGMLMRAGLREEQVRAEPLLVKLPDLKTRQNVSARFVFTDDKLTELLFTFESDDIAAVKSQADTWNGSLRTAYGSKPTEASTSPEGYRVEGWCVAAGVEVTTITKGNLVALDYIYDQYGVCRDIAVLPGSQPEATLYRLPVR